MLKLVKQFFVPPKNLANEEQNRHATLLGILVNACLLFAILIFAGYLFDRSIPLRTDIIVLAIIALCLFFRWLLWAGKLNLTTVGFLIFGFIASILVSASAGTIRDPSSVNFLLLVFAAGLLFKFKGVIISTLASSLAILGLVLAQSAGLLPPPETSVNLMDWFSLSIALAITGGLTSFAYLTTLRALDSSDKVIIENEKVELELRKLTRAVEQSPASIVITDLTGAIEYVNPRFTEISGYSLEEVLGKNPRILKTDQTPPETYQKLWTALTSGAEWQGEFVNRKKNGDTYYESAVITPIKSRDGTITHYLAVKEDISERKKAEEVLRESEAKYRIVADNTYDWEFWYGPEGNYIYISPSCERVSGYTVDEILADPGLSERMVHPEDRPLVEKHIKLIRHYVKDELDYRIMHKDGSIRWVSHACRPVFDENGAYLGARGSNRDITARKQVEADLKNANMDLRLRIDEVESLQAELRDQALRDPLTSLYNRRFLNEVLPHEFIRARREGRCISVLFIDIDHFKVVNDTYGHAAGDEFIKEIACQLMGSARGSDLVCRFGGEEFLLVMPGMTSASALVRAEQIRKKCADTALADTGLSLTLSVGVATFPEHGSDIDEILVRADDALYQSKQNGRNQVTLWCKSEA